MVVVGVRGGEEEHFVNVQNYSGRPMLVTQSDL